MELNKLVPAKDWVKHQNQNIEKLCLKGKRITNLTGVNGWSCEDSYIQTLPTLDGEIRLFRVSIKESGVQPNTPQNMITFPEEFIPTINPGVINPMDDQGGHFGGNMSVYFYHNNISGQLIPLDGQRSPQDIKMEFLIVYC